MTEYALRKNDILGKTAESEKDYDLMTVILIRQGETQDMQEGIFDYLGSLMRGDIKRAEKYTKSRWSETMKGDVKTMTGFGEAIYQRGIKYGEETGLRHGEVIGKSKLIQKALQSGKTKEQIAEFLEIPLEEVQDIAIQCPEK